METFEAALRRIAGPRLRGLGYEFDSRLQVGDELFGFRKDMGDGIHAIIQFYHRRSVRHSFTINLISAKSDDIQPRMYGGYAGARGARLSYVLWFVHHLHDLVIPDYWWEIPDQDRMEAALSEVLGCFEYYGVPWLEAPQPPKPWEMPPQRVHEFADRVHAVVAPEMADLGYRLDQLALAGNLPYLFFSKAMPDGTFALVELEPIYSLDPERFNFDVRLQRRYDRSPVTPIDLQLPTRSASLAQLLWARKNELALPGIAVAQMKTLFWSYYDRVELDAQLRAALQQIVQLGLPWLEHPDETAR